MSLSTKTQGLAYCAAKPSPGGKPTRSEYSERIQRTNDRCNNLLTRQYQEIEKARRIAHADIVFEKKSLQQVMRGFRRSQSFPVPTDVIRHKALQQRLKADQMAHSERLRLFLSTATERRKSTIKETLDRIVETNHSQSDSQDMDEEVSKIQRVPQKMVPEPSSKRDTQTRRRSISGCN